MKIQVGIADDHTMFRKGLAEIIAQMSDFEVVLEAEDGNILMAHLESIRPRVIIVDLKMPGLDGFEVIQRISEEYPDIRMIALSMFDDDRFIIHAFQQGVHGYLLKNADPGELEKAMRQVHEEGYYVSDYIGKILAKGLKKKVSKPGFEEFHISEREVEILGLICQGLTNEEIGAQIFLSKRTVESHRKSLIERAEVRNTAELVAWAFRNKILD